MEAHYNGSLEISEAYNRVTRSNLMKLTPPILLLTIGALFVMFRSWRVTALVMGAVLVSLVWTMGLYVLMGFTFNILASMMPPLVMILAVADDVHIVQHFTEDLRATGSSEHAFKSSVRNLFAPLLGASATTALGLAVAGDQQRRRRPRVRRRRRGRRDGRLRDVARAGADAADAHQAVTEPGAAGALPGWADAARGAVLDAPCQKASSSGRSC